MKILDKHVIGRVESVSLPEWNIDEIDAKIDTGAYSSSLHCHKIEQFKHHQENWVRFNLLDPDHQAYNEQLIQLPIHDIRSVKSSNGIAQDRFFIKTTITLFSTIYDIELSLTDRSEMKYPLLLGRKFLKNKFLVDVSQKYVSNSEQLDQGSK
ncbi:ATP-dependent zinc protease [Balneola vulgaris]|uniref:ATP-dependent zinc protease family protein n=1 Tax=Balneola vulgaris TaxID=287535 RepID=UPI0003780AEB|nr:RimK/LysX family protein [Balneola vulgaris]